MNCGGEAELPSCVRTGFDWALLRYTPPAPFRHPFSHLSSAPASFIDYMFVIVQVVPMESAYPGVGDFVALHGVDHINACKPSSPTDASYVRALEFIQQRLEDARAEASDREQPMWDRVPGAN